MENSNTFTHLKEIFSPTIDDMLCPLNAFAEILSSVGMLEDVVKHSHVGAVLEVLVSDLRRKLSDFEWVERS